MLAVQAHGAHWWSRGQSLLVLTCTCSFLIEALILQGLTFSHNTSLSFWACLYLPSNILFLLYHFKVCYNLVKWSHFGMKRMSVGKTVRHLHAFALPCIVLYYSYVSFHCFSILKLCPDIVSTGLSLQCSTWGAKHLGFCDSLSCSWEIHLYGVTYTIDLKKMYTQIKNQVVMVSFSEWLYILYPCQLATAICLYWLLG